MVDVARLIPKLVITLAVLTGRVSLLLFLAFLFMGSFNLIRFGFSDTAVLVWDGGLAILFFVQHSIMIRRSFRSRFADVVPPLYHGAVFTIVSGIMLTTLVLTWQTSTLGLHEFHGLARWMLRGVFCLGLAVFVWGMFTLRSLKAFDPFGLAAVVAHMRGRQLEPPKFIISGPYVYVRHPLYLAMLMLIWSNPDLTADRLLFNILSTVWIYLATILEEADLLRDFGESYREYQGKVRMLIPWPT
jgi:methanethiol S-methyltransferase